MNALPIRSLVALLMVLLHSSLFAEEITIEVRDSRTGQAVAAEALLLNTAGEALQQFAGPEFAIDGYRGAFLLAVQADGYAPLTTWLTAVEDKRLRMRIFLDLGSEVEEATAEYVATLIREDRMLVHGFLSDEVSGLPLGNVRIRSASGEETLSDSRGYFLLQLPLDRVSDDLFIEKAGFAGINRRNIQLWPGGDWMYRLAMQRGSGMEVVNESREAREAQDLRQEDCVDCDNHYAAHPERVTPPVFQTSPLLKPSIRVGRNCSGTSCVTVEVYTLSNYCRLVLPHEWFNCWGSLSNGLNSLMAGAVAIRTYASWHVNHPISSFYDICDNTSCQFLGSTTAQNSDFAVAGTDRYVLLSNNVITRSEYSAENNNKGCGDGYTGTGTSWPCIADPVCAGQIPNGHGRGMCQWGSARWASGTFISTGSPCSPGPTHSFGTKTWQEILAHYYPTYTLEEGSSASIVASTANPNSVPAGGRFDILYSISAAPSFELMLGGSIATTGSNNFIDDSANDAKVTVNNGTTQTSRPFDVPASTPPGFYDLLSAIWFDVDGNNQINTGDFQFEQKRLTLALNVGVTGIERLDEVVPRNYALEQNYPNPFNPSTTIAFSLPVDSRVTLRVFDALGKQVGLLVDEQLTAGSYQSNWDGSGLASGIYFYRLEAANRGQTRFLQTRKLILSR